MQTRLRIITPTEHIFLLGVNLLIELSTLLSLKAKVYARLDIHVINIGWVGSFIN